MDEVDRSSWNDVSQAALKRLDEAKTTFDTYVSKNKTIDDWVRIIEPNVHLTGVTWKQFKTYASDKGFESRRKKLTDSEKKEAKEVRKSAVYFIEIKTQKEKSEPKKRDSTGKKKGTGDDKVEPSKRPKRETKTKIQSVVDSEDDE